MCISSPGAARSACGQRVCDPPTQETNAKDRGFTLCQPGSSVATALSEGEAKPKHVQLLEINGAAFRLIKFPLETVRPFIFESVRMLPDDAPGLQTSSHSLELA